MKAWTVVFACHNSGDTWMWIETVEVSNTDSMSPSLIIIRARDKCAASGLDISDIMDIMVLPGEVESGGTMTPLRW